MPHFVQQADFVSLCALASAAALLGLVGLLGRRRRARRPWLAPLALAFALGAAGGLAGAAGWDRPYWLAPAALAGVLLAFALARTPLFQSAGRACLAGAGHARLQAAVLLVAGGGLLGAQLYRFDTDDSRDFLDRVARDSTQVVLTDLPRAASTDAGRPVPLAAARIPAGPGRDDQSDAGLLDRRGLRYRVIQTGSTDLACNCHGWVFAAGRYWVRGGAVELILKDNGYQAVSRPLPGDVAVWRNVTGEVTHSGLVRSAPDDGSVLIESKWGQAGRFIHTAADHAYRQDNCTYYRTTRASHVLRGVLDAPAGKRAVAQAK